MKILMLTPYLPYPLISGGQIRSYNLLKNVADKHEITLVSLIKHENEKQYIPQIAQFCSRVIVAFRPQHPWTLNNIAKTAFGKYPFLVVRNYSSEARSTVEHELKTQQYDLIHAETFYVMPHIPQTKIPILLVEQTIEYEVYQHFVETIRFPLLRPVLTVDVKKIQYWENFYWKKASRVVAMSEPDRQSMLAHNKQLDVSIVPNGIDTQFFTFNRNVNKKNPQILFVGNFKWLQNREAVMTLVNEVWPYIAQKLPQAKLLIVGRFPPKELASKQSDRIKIAANLDDIRQAYKSCDVLLAPIYGPGGTRYKILEAMACGLPVITTPLGIAGLGVSDGVEALVRTSAQALADGAIEVLTNQKLYSKISKNAYALVTKTYNWKKIAQDLDDLYEEVAHEKN